MKQGLKEFTIKAKLLAEKKDLFGYTLYVFQDLENYNIHEKYITLVRFPNWEQSPFNINEEGFVHFKIVEAGQDEWYDPNSKRFYYYNYTNMIFLQFIPLKPTTGDQIYILD